MEYPEILKYLVIQLQKITHTLREASSMKVAKYQLPPNDSTSMGLHTSECTKLNNSNFLLAKERNETLWCFPNRQNSQGLNAIPLLTLINPFLTSINNPFFPTWLSLLCYKFSNAPSSTTLRLSLQIFTCVLYSMLQTRPLLTTIAPFVNFQVSLPKWRS